MKPTYDLEADLKASDMIGNKCKDDDYAKMLYGSLTNMQWCKVDVMPILTEDYWSASFRYSAGIIAEIRNCGENYMDWYCSSSEGVVGLEVEADLKTIGWIPIEYED